MPVGAALAAVVLRSQVDVHFEHWSEFNANEQHIWHKLDGIPFFEASTCWVEGVVLGT